MSYLKPPDKCFPIHHVEQLPQRWFFCRFGSPRVLSSDKYLGVRPFTNVNIYICVSDRRSARKGQSSVCKQNQH